VNVDLFQRILEAMDEVVILQDAQGRLIYVSPFVQHLLGFAPKELLGTPGADLFHPEDRSRGEPTAAEPLPEEAASASQLRCRTRDGSYRWVRVRRGAMRDEGGQIFLLLRLSDLGMDRLPEEQRDEMGHRKALGRLAGGIAHEFNNLLTIVTGYTCILLEVHGPGDSEHGALSQIQRAAERAAELVRQLLAVAGRQMLQPVITDVNAVVLSLTEVFKRLLGPAIRLHLHLDPSVPPIRVDPTPLRRVLLDLAANARDAMPAGGDFTLATANVPADRLPSGMPAGAAVRLTATDTGRGMDEQTLRRVFEPFFTTKEVGQGMGLSLAAAYGTARQCGGQLTVASQPGTGTTFTLTLPHAPPQEE
jgi:two-component system cell cycle sensor histidine kinase/response regulator CckA